MNWIVQPQNPNSGEQPLTCGFWFTVGKGAFVVAAWLFNECKGEGALCSELSIIDTGNCE